jgi:cytochrome c5
VLTSLPASCTGGTPVTSQSCTYVPPVTTCTSFTYSAYGVCQSNSTQTRTVLTSLPASCTGGTPVTSQACTYVPPAIDGLALYNQYCGGCHGNRYKGALASDTKAAIDGNVGGMGSAALRALTPAQLDAIAAAP